MGEMPFPLAQFATRQNTPAVSALHPARSQFDASRVLRLWHLASLDAPTVAVVWSLAFASVAKIYLPFWVPVLLALATWSIYIGDRLLDARRALRTGALHSLRERHFFHWRHRRLLLPSAGMAALLAAGIIFTCMPVLARERNSVLAVAALAYFSGVHLPHHRSQRFAALLSKEFLVGVLFTAGCALPTLSRVWLVHTAPRLFFPWIVPVVFFAALAWLNCCAIDCWESRAPSRIVTHAGLLALPGLAFAALLASAEPASAALLLAGCASLGLLALLDRFRDGMTPVSLRAAADLVLLTPLALLLR
ncbi:MAG: hypothetical protein WBV28_21010 [Terracidiphilus sp.]